MSSGLVDPATQISNWAISSKTDSLFSQPVNMEVSEGECN